MSQREQNFRMDYIEFPATNIEATKRFYHQVFGWEFTDYGPGYTSFNDGRLGGGFNSESQPAGADGAKTRGVLVVLYATSLDDTRGTVMPPAARSCARSSSFPAASASTSPIRTATSSAVWSE